MQPQDTVLQPVDVEFESFVRELKDISEQLIQSPENSGLKARFMRHLLECRIVFEKVVIVYGNRYRSGKGADHLIQIVNDTIKVFQGGWGSPFVESFQRYSTDIRGIQKRIFPNSPNCPVLPTSP